MRVEDTASPVRSSGDPARSDRFSAAFRDARRKLPARSGPSAALEPIATRRALGARRAAADRKDATLGDRREGFREELRPPAPQPAFLASPQPRPSETSSPPAELRALVRALPPAIDAARVRAGEPLALAFGSALSVELTAVPAGVDLLLRPGADLARAARAELPRIVEALRARGITVSRAEVLPRAHGAPPAARVDGARALR